MPARDDPVHHVDDVDGSSGTASVSVTRQSNCFTSLALVLDLLVSIFLPFHLTPTSLPVRAR